MGLETELTAHLQGGVAGQVAGQLRGDALLEIGVVGGVEEVLVARVIAQARE